MSDKRNDNIFGEPIELGEPDKIEWAFVEKSKYEALLAEALKLEAALERIGHRNEPDKWDNEDMIFGFLYCCEEVIAEANEALAQFKKWREKC